ncbi:S-4TM family putative pore-forming effector [Fusobacterium sp.]|uniref:S-4TM family putative pore-forming effector n=1 Tax=Fusobacterium sp. TaxID=68766 RepID=UPI00260BEC45|nr:S-4TM family putative pore-forming effector [Fusobacterium sp.]
MTSNDIITRQNEENSIMMLAAQRELYRKAKRTNNFYIFTSLVLPFLLLLLSIKISKDFSYLNYFLVIINMVIAYYIDIIVINYKKSAAFIQQKFDIYVYGMKWNKRIFGEDKDISHLIVTNSTKILNNPEEKARLYNWYTPSINTNNLVNIILSCQKENYYWDIGLRKRLIIVSKIITFLLVISIFIIGIFFNKNVKGLISDIIFIIPILHWLITIVKSLDKDIKNLEELDKIFNKSTKKTFNDLEDIQNILFKHRENCYTVPEVIYNIFKDNDEDLAHKRAEIS